MDWHKRIQVLKGTFGETIAKDYLRNQGRVIYVPESDKAHPFDFLSFKGKEEPEILEVKSKARMNDYYATGIDRRHARDYWRMYKNYNIDTFLLFIDEHPAEKRMYGQKISVLAQKYIAKDGRQYPFLMKRKGTQITLFSLESMIEIGKLTDEQCNQLRKLSKRSYQYR